MISEALCNFKNIVVIYDVQKSLLCVWFIEFRRAQAVMIRWHHDATPMQLRFDKLQDLLAPHARYAIPEVKQNGLKVWKLVNYEEYCKFSAHRSPGLGILEVIIMTTEIM